VVVITLDFALQCGLPNCGIVIGQALAKTGLGDTLLQAALTLSIDELEIFLVTWWQDLQTELLSNMSGYLPQRFPALAKPICDTFPDCSHLLSYVKPKTSQHETTEVPDLSKLQPCIPDIAQLASLCKHHLGWENNPGSTLTKLEDFVWDRICMQMLCYPVSLLNRFPFTFMHP
jgi:holliday junction resolvase YEN1